MNTDSSITDTAGTSITFITLVSLPYNKDNIVSIYIIPVIYVKSLPAIFTDKVPYFFDEIQDITLKYFSLFIYYSASSVTFAAAEISRQSSSS